MRPLASLLTVFLFTACAPADRPRIGETRAPIGEACGQDADCAGSEFCDPGASLCAAKLANGTPIPVLSGHLPDVSGICSPAVAKAVCASGVCDLDNACGYANGRQGCVPQIAATVCRSGVCGNDDTCGYPSGQGPCVGTDQVSANPTCKSSRCGADGLCGLENGAACTKDTATLCRGGVCETVSQVCGTYSTCSVDGDCGGFPFYCDANHGTCDVRSFNGQPIPKDALHDGTCTPENAQALCFYRVCESDNLCGYANGDGPCTDFTTCRSNNCSATTHLCEAPNACAGDADCNSGFCDEPNGACTAKLSNGSALPTAPHEDPALDGVCTPAVGALVCQSGVCDTDNACGLANGTAAQGNPYSCRSQVVDTDGKCGLANGTTIPPGLSPTACRSGVATGTTCGLPVGAHCADVAQCQSDDCHLGLCIPTNGCLGAQDCSTGSYCDPTAQVCRPYGDVGAACSPALLGTDCEGGVCSAHGRCGYEDGQGSCTTLTAALVCQSGFCEPSGVCGDVHGCFRDVDCAGGTYCDEAAGTCAPKVANNAALPTDPAHTEGRLDGACTAVAGAIACLTGVCDPKDDRCGIDLGDLCGASDDCRGASCDAITHVCVITGSCASDAACVAGGFYCNAAAGTCDPDAQNGEPVPTDPKHQPPLYGLCTTLSGAIACETGVCDVVDNRCGRLPGSVCQKDGDCRQGPCEMDTHTCGAHAAGAGGAPMSGGHGGAAPMAAGQGGSVGGDASGDDADDSSADDSSTDGAVDSGPRSTRGGCSTGGGSSGGGFWAALGLLGLASRRRRRG